MEARYQRSGMASGRLAVAVAENPAETLAPDVNPACQSRVLLMRPSESGAPGLNKAPAGPFDPAGLGPGKSGAPGLNKTLARADGTGQGTRRGGWGHGVQPIA